VAYPVHVRIAHREPRSRASTAFRAVLVVPHLVAVVVLGAVAVAAGVAAWVAVLLTGRYPPALFAFAEGTLRYATRVWCYWMLVTDRFPPFALGAQAGGDAVEVWVDEPAARSRRTAAVRMALAVPAWIILYYLVVFSWMMAFAAWWAILVTGRLPRSMFEVMELPHRYHARVWAYTWLLTDVYPWFQEEGGSRPWEWGIEVGAGPAPE
jgi:Domain of unknown function (DUF4389)